MYIQNEMWVRIKRMEPVPFQAKRDMTARVQIKMGADLRNSNMRLHKG